MLTFKNTNLLLVVNICIILVLDYYYFIPFWIYIGILFIWLLAIAWGSFFIQSNFYFPSLHSNNKTPKNQVSITFDDGPHPDFTPKALELLKKYDAKATFFCVGKNIENYPTIFKQIISQGHTVGNHTYCHTNWYGFFSTKKVIQDLQQTNNIVKQLTTLNLKLYRPAFGVTNPRIKKAIKKLNIQTIGWSKRSLDTTSLSPKKVLKRITKNLDKGDVILLHDTSQKSILVLEQLLLFLQEQNIKSVTIDSLFKIKAYA